MYTYNFQCVLWWRFRSLTSYCCFSIKAKLRSALRLKQTRLVGTPRAPLLKRRIKLLYGDSMKKLSGGWRRWWPNNTYNSVNDPHVMPVLDLTDAEKFQSRWWRKERWVTTILSTKPNSWRKIATFLHFYRLENCNTRILYSFTESAPKNGPSLS